jgi:hypothetical protein
MQIKAEISLCFRLVFSCHSDGSILHINLFEKQFILWFGLVYLIIHSVTHVALDTSITDYNLYITTQLIIYGHPPNIISNNKKFKDQLELSLHIDICVFI